MLFISRSLSLLTKMATIPSSTLQKNIIRRGLSIGLTIGLALGYNSDQNKVTVSWLHEQGFHRVW